MVTHTFKSKEMKDKFNEVLGDMSREDMIKSSTSDKAKCQMTYYTPGDTMTMFCHYFEVSDEGKTKVMMTFDDTLSMFNAMKK